MLTEKVVDIFQVFDQFANGVLRPDPDPPNRQYQRWSCTIYRHISRPRQSSLRDTCWVIVLSTADLRREECFLSALVPRYQPICYACSVNCTLDPLKYPPSCPREPFGLFFHPCGTRPPNCRLIALKNKPIWTYTIDPDPRLFVPIVAVKHRSTWLAFLTIRPVLPSDEGVVHIVSNPVVWNLPTSVPIGPPRFLVWV